MEVLYYFTETFACFSHHSARQPVVTLIEDLVERATAKWSKTDEKIENCMDKLLQLQRDRLELEWQHLELKSHLAGLPDPKKSVSKKCEYNIKYSLCL